MVCERDRVEYGLNNQDIVYIKIKDLTKEEHDDFMKTLKENDVEIERKTSEVEKVLEESEETEDISIVQASMIGSRGWGYEDKESDIDIRFIFVRDPRDYISILQHEDSIAYPIEDKKDIVGYDLGKFLRMICNQNPMAFEIIHSPKQERENEHVNRIRSFADEVMDPNRMIMIYQKLVSERINELQEKKENTTKLALYILRMLGIIHYMEQNGTFPICSIEEIFKDNANDHLKSLVEELVEYKKNGQKDLNMNPKFIEFLKNDLEKTKGITVTKELKDKKEIEKEANTLFLQTVMEVQKKKKEEEMKKVNVPEKETEEKEVNYK